MYLVNKSRILGMVFAAMVTVGCGVTDDASTQQSSSQSANGLGTIRTFVSSGATGCTAPDGPFQAVLVTVVDVQAHVSASAADRDAGWVDLAPGLRANPIQVNLLGNNDCFLAKLGATQLTAGHYQQIRIILAEQAIGYGLTNNPCGTLANCVILKDGSVEPLRLSSQDETGIKINSGQLAGGKFEVEAGQTVDLNIAFNACDSVLIQGDGTFQLKPTLSAGEVELNPNCAAQATP